MHENLKTAAVDRSSLPEMTLCGGPGDDRVAGRRHNGEETGVHCATATGSRYMGMKSFHSSMSPEDFYPHLHCKDYLGKERFQEII